MRWRAAAWLLACGMIAGCADNEPKRFRVSGKVTFNGQPIPHGDVLFTPDGAKKNSGAQGIATIRDGEFDTTAVGGKGYGGGPAVIRVTGLAAPGGKLLCVEEFSVDLPQGDATHNIEVSAKSGVKPTTGSGP
ncbi:MAG: hypothetical protein K8U57_09425 [Planctomycetes bacterium]|nr:hypothetical protein [Planctomycetota bacterium]